MAFTCGFFNSVAHDRKYDAVQHGMIFDGIITDGIYATYLKAMVVKASENASEVIVQPGRAWFNHTWSYNDSDYPVAAPEPEVVLDRIDTLVLDVNSEDAVRNNQFLWVQGTPTSQTPEPPALIHTATHNQYPLCDVYRQAGTTMIYAADITNRVGTSDCPFVTGVLESIDIDDLLAQWDDEFHTWENATKASFEGWMINQQQVYTAWFNALKTQMAGDVADVEAWVQTIKDIIDEETATHLQLEIDEINSMLPSGSHITVTTSDTELYSRTVTITDEDNNTVTSQFDANGVAVFKSVPYVGNLTITSTDGVRTATEVVNTPYFARYEFTLAFWSATVNIIGDSVFGGDTVTITDSTTALVGTVVLNASGAGVFNATYPDTYKFSVTHGGETMEVSLAVTQETTYNVEIHSGLNYQAWLNAGRVSKSFSSLDEVLEDEKTLRQLFLVHDAVDYICDSFNVGSVTDITKIFNTDLAAKWINNSDYALDHFYAVADIKSIMDTADKYGYGEWVITDDTTTPPTWGPKGNVPVMTANNAPYGTASASSEHSSTYQAYKAFDNDTSTNWRASNTAVGNKYSIQYKFVNPTCIKRVLINKVLVTTNPDNDAFVIYGSNDGSTWESIGNGTSYADGTDHLYDTTNDSYYLYGKVEFTATVTNTDGHITAIQFYGRELKVSVPVMTSNTAPFGVASASSQYNNTFAAWKAFNKTNSGEQDSWIAGTLVVSGEWIAYEFNSPTIVKLLTIRNRNYSGDNNGRVKSFKLQGSNTGNTNDWTDIGDLQTRETAANAPNYLTSHDYSDNSILYKYNRILVEADYSNNRTGIGELQFYGLDYSEKEFEIGTTKKWLYDHGVELEILSNRNSGVSAPIYGSDCITLASTGSGQYCQAYINMDLSDYDLVRAKSYRYAASNAKIAVQNNDFSSNLASSEVSTNGPYNSNLDISSINQTANLMASNNSGASSIWELAELWLE